MVKIWDSKNIRVSLSGVVLNEHGTDLACEIRLNTDVTNIKECLNGKTLTSKKLGRHGVLTIYLMSNSDSYSELLILNQLADFTRFMFPIIVWNENDGGISYTLRDCIMKSFPVEQLGREVKEVAVEFYFGDWIPPVLTTTLQRAIN